MLVRWKSSSGLEPIGEAKAQHSSAMSANTGTRMIGPNRDARRGAVSVNCTNASYPLGPEPNVRRFRPQAAGPVGICDANFATTFRYGLPWLSSTNFAIDVIGSLLSRVEVVDRAVRRADERRGRRADLQQRAGERVQRHGRERVRRLEVRADGVDRPSRAHVVLRSAGDREAQERRRRAGTRRAASGSSSSTS